MPFVSGTTKAVKAPPRKQITPYIQNVPLAPMAWTRSTKVLLAMKPSMKQRQMLKALPIALTLGGRSSATTTQMRVP